MSSMPATAQVKKAQAVRSLVPAQKITDQVAESIIDPRLPSAERTKLVAKLRGLRLRLPSGATAKNVVIALIDGDAKHVYYNRPELRGTLIQTSSGATPLHAVSKTRIHPDFFDQLNKGSGPYRRIVSASYMAPLGDAAAYPEAVATVSTPCANGEMISTSNGFAYMGGWSGSNAAIDAGLQYDYKLPTHAQDWYTPFIRWNGVTYSEQYASSGNGWYPSGPATHVSCGGQTTLAFAVEDDDMSYFPESYFILSVQSGGLTQFLVYEGLDVSASGYNAACSFCVFKRMTSIGQKLGAENLQSGESFSANWGWAQVSCGFGYGCLSGFEGNMYPWISSSCSEYPAWYGSWAAGGRDCTSTPAVSAGATPNPINVTYFGGTGENDHIALPGPSPATISSATEYTGTASVSGLKYDIKVQPNDGAGNAWFTLYLANASGAPMTVEGNQCLDTGIRATGTSTSGMGESWQFPGDSRCVMVLYSLPLPADGDPVFIEHEEWPSSNLRSLSFSESLVGLGVNAGTQTSQVSIAAQGSIGVIATPIPIRTPPPNMCGTKVCY